MRLYQNICIKLAVVWIYKALNLLTFPWLHHSMYFFIFNIGICWHIRNQDTAYILNAEKFKLGLFPWHSIPSLDRNSRRSRTMHGESYLIRVGLFYTFLIQANFNAELRQENERNPSPLRLLHLHSPSISSPLTSHGCPDLWLSRQIMFSFLCVSCRN